MGIHTFLSDLLKASLGRLILFILSYIKGLKVTAFVNLSKTRK